MAKISFGVLSITILFFCSLALYYYFISSVGGVSEIFSNISSRQDLYAGSGYLMKMSIVLLQFSSLLLYWRLAVVSKWLSYLLVIAVALLLLILGSRMAVLGFLFMVFVLHDAVIKPIKFRFYYIPIFLVLVFVAIIIGELRSAGEYSISDLKYYDVSESSADSYVLKMVPYTIPVKRDAVILSYYEKNDYWYGGVYYSVLMAPVPRRFNQEKPPVDTGRYVVAMYEGYMLQPPMPSDFLPNYGWPPSFMEGYMVIGYFGVILNVFVSVAFLVFLYRWMIYSFSIPLLMVYASLIFRNGFYLDSLTIVSILTLMLFVSVATLLLKFIQFSVRV